MAKDIKEYTGEQVVLSSGRLVFNSRSNDIYLSSNRYINLSAKEKITIDVGKTDSDNEQNMFLVNAPRIQFGLDKNGLAEGVVKAEQLDAVLTQLMEALTEYSAMVQAAAIAPGPIMALLLAASATPFLSGRLSAIKVTFDSFKSKTTYTI